MGFHSRFCLPPLPRLSPPDKDQWRTRCAGLVQSGAFPKPDASGLPATRLKALARERSASGQHFVGCNLFFAAAAGSSPAGNAQKTREDMSLAKIEQKIGAGQRLSFVDKLMRSSDILGHASIGRPTIYLAYLDDNASGG